MKKETKARNKKRRVLARKEAEQELAVKKEKAVRLGVLAAVCVVCMVVGIWVGVTLMKSHSKTDEVPVVEQDPKTEYYMTVQYSVNTADSTLDTASVVDACKTIVSSRKCIDRVIEESGSSLSYEEVKAMLLVSQVDDTELFDVSVSSENRDDVKDIGNALKALLPEMIEEIIGGPVTLEIVESSFQGV